jgi:hypothetical protein
LSLANHLEAGRRVPSALVLERLSPLAAHMLPEAADVPLPTAPPAGRLDPGPLQKRRAACLHEAYNLRWQLR